MAVQQLAEQHSALDTKAGKLRQNLVGTGYFTKDKNKLCRKICVESFNFVCLKIDLMGQKISLKRSLRSSDPSTPTEIRQKRYVEFRPNMRMTNF